MTNIDKLDINANSYKSFMKRLFVALIAFTVMAEGSIISRVFLGQVFIPHSWQSIWTLDD